MQGLIDWAACDIHAIKGATYPMTKLTEYLHTAAAAEYLGVAQNTIRKWAARGDIPMHRNPANGYRLFKRSDLDSFLKKTARPIKVTK
jgi:excisionase family DNA binding protein